jgi:hypothetical protein
MTDKEVMQQALEALEGVYLSLQLPDLLKVVGPITALREALAQPEQEPDRGALQAAGIHPAPCARHCEAKAFEIEIRSLKSALRRALKQPEQEPTCPECKAAVLYECVACSSNNYPPKPEHEPVGEVLNERGEIDYISYVPPVGTRLYTTPPAAQPEQVDCPRCGHVCSQLPWVGLTDEEANLLWENTDDRDSWELIKRVEAKLKERNT